MTLARRVAAFLHPAPDIDYTLIALDRQAEALVSIAKSLHNIDRKTAKRRSRIVECRHPELHPEMESDR